MEYLDQEAKEKEEGISSSTSDYGVDALTRAFGKTDHRGYVKVFGKSGVGVGHQKAFGKVPRHPPSSVDIEEVRASLARDFEISQARVVQELNEKWEERWKAQEQMIQSLVATLSAQNPSLMSQIPPQPPVAEVIRFIQ